jgi:hypothetical protein
MLTDSMRRKVEARAFDIFREKEPRRTLRDWQKAQTELHQELRRQPTEREIQDRAEELWLSRKDADARGDWLEAESICYYRT